MTKNCVKVLLTGGAASGKSSLGEALAAQLPGPHCYLATMQPYGAEGQAKIDRHRRLRAGLGFHTIERYTNFAGLNLADACSHVQMDCKGDRPIVLLECACNLLSNEMFDEVHPYRTNDEIFSAVVEGIEALASQCRALIVITNDVGADGIAYDGFTEDYVQLLGKINCALAARFDVVAEVCAGVPIAVKGSFADFFPAGCTLSCASDSFHLQLCDKGEDA